MGADGSAESSVAGSVISLPAGGGAIAGLGEKFTPDLFTGTGNFAVPIELPPGRSGLVPRLSLGYSTGRPNGPFGSGWQLSLPGIARRTAKGVPRYADATGPGADRPDVFVLSGAEDLVPVADGSQGRTRYRPRTEGSFARIEHVRDDSGDYWEVRGTDGSLTRYGTPRPTGVDPGWQDPATVTDPADRTRVFGWRITTTTDPMGNLIRYDYLRDSGEEPGHRWDQPLLAGISYADHGDRADPSFLVRVGLGYERRPDPFSDHRPGFELRTSLRCTTLTVSTHPADGTARTARQYRFGYQPAPFSGVSLLTRVDVVGVDGGSEQPLPPLTFDYTRFDPAGRRFEPVTGPGLPGTVLTDRSLGLVDLRGVGLPDVVELGAAGLSWTNTGEGRFSAPRRLPEAPPFSLADPSVRFLDADGDGRPDLLVSATTGASGPAPMAGYFPVSAGGGWSRRGFRPYRQVPSVALADPSVALVDLDGDGLTDVLRSGSRLECWFNDPDPRRAWLRNIQVDGRGPRVDLADPRVRLADMTGDGLQDIVLIETGKITYWPNQGHGRWGEPVVMRNSPRLPDRHDPRRVLLGDLDGNGAADLVYVDRGRVLLWGNRSGNGWTDAPIVVAGTPDVTDVDSVQLSDLHGTGMAGLLLSRTGTVTGRPYLRFLDLTGAVKPYLLAGVDNHLGARTQITYAPSTREYLRDQRDPATRWRTTLPFPVHVVAAVEVTDVFSGGRITSEFRYHHGYWDGVEREFRGFAMVEQTDTESFPATVTPTAGGTADNASGDVPDEHFSPPTLTRSWFHPGPVAAAGTLAGAGDWVEIDLGHEYWSGDAPMLSRPPTLTAFLADLGRAARRSALRAMRGQLLRTELYALDGEAQADRPYTVTETLVGVREEAPPDDPDRERVFFPFVLGRRTTRWERGAEPMTRFTFPAGYDPYGMSTGELQVAVPRGRDPRLADPAATRPYLAALNTVERARRDDAERYLVDRVARTTGHEVGNDGRLSVPELRDAVLGGSGGPGLSLALIGHHRTYYDGDAFTGLPLGTLGEHGLPVRSEVLACTDAFLDELYSDPTGISPRPPYLVAAGEPAWTADYRQEFRDLLPARAGYLHYADGDVPGSPGGWYVVTERRRYDVHEQVRTPRGLPLATLDPLGAAGTIDYDQHDLLPVRVTDAAGLVTEADNDYRVLRPATVTDVNGNVTTVTFSPIGLVTATFVRGKGGAGDATVPGTALSYDLLAVDERGEPASVRTVRRVHHDTDTDVPAARRDEALTSVSYSDGFGRVLQTRAQAEDTLFGEPVFGGGVLPADESVPVGGTTGRTRAPSDPDNVVVSGWQVHDNKGRVVHRYEPFFATGYDYGRPGEAQLGQRTTLFYDPRGQVVRTLRPDGGEERVLYGVPADLADPDGFTPTPWEVYHYDANDNAGRTHPDTAAAYRDHWDTPASTEIDALGRAVRTVARNGASASDELTTTSTYDIQGNLLTVTDPLGRQAFGYRYDLLRRRWRAEGIDDGRRDSVLDALGHAVEARDSKGALVLSGYDLLRRPVRTWARHGAGGPIGLCQLIVYGDAGTIDQPPPDRGAARALNLLGRPVRQYDGAGLVTTGSVDFKGNLLDSTRQVIADAPILATYAAAAATGWQVQPFALDWTPGPGRTRADRDAELLEPGGYSTTTGYDALSRVTSQLLPTDVEGIRRALRPVYNRAGTAESIELDEVPYVRRIAYDAKGQRALVAYGNGIMTRYVYDPHTFRLTRLRSEPYAASDGPTYQPTGAPVQDQRYDHDLAGNLLVCRDRAPGSGIPVNPTALDTSDPVLRRLLGSGDALDRAFSYDPVYRLLAATGRECQQPPGGDPWIDLPRGTDPTLAQPYTESYRYDAAGNLLSLAHTGRGGFTRTYEVAPDSNRLRRMTVGGTPYDYRYDPSGNLVTEAAVRHFSWNQGGHLVAFGTQTAGAEPSVHAQYLYDSTGARVKKLVRRQGGAVEVTHYIGMSFEHHRWSTPAPGGANNQIHVVDGQHRVAMVRVGPAHPADRGPSPAFHLADNLGSSTAVLDAAGALTNGEEYTPYGETSFGSYTLKRFRFTGTERDEESGLGYHRARYYAPSLARWTSADPIGRHGGTNLFAYAADNPVRLVDPLGTQPAAAEPPMIGHEIIYVTGTRPPDNYGTQVLNGLSRPLPTPGDYESALAAELESGMSPSSKALRDQFYAADPEGSSQRFHEWAMKGYEKDQTSAVAGLEHQQRVMGAALPFVGLALLGAAIASLGAWAAPCLVEAGTATGAGSTSAGIFVSVAHSIRFWQQASGSEAPAVAATNHPGDFPATDPRIVESDKDAAANRAAIEGQPAGHAFSGVYDPQTGTFHARLSSGPDALVDRNGGHGFINEQVFGGSNETVGFTVFVRDGHLEIGWNSLSVNYLNYGDRAAPEFFQLDITTAVEMATGMEVR